MSAFAGTILRCLRCAIGRPSVRLLLVLILNQLIFDLNFLQVTTIARWKLKVKVTGQGHSSTSNLCQQHRPIKNKPETFKSLTTVFYLTLPWNRLVRTVSVEAAEYSETIVHNRATIIDIRQRKLAIS